MDEAAALGKFVNEVGIPGAALAFLAFVAWRTGKFLAPLLRDFFSGHKALIVNLQETNTAQTGIMARQELKLDSHGQKLEEHGHLLSDHGEQLGHIRIVLDEVHGVVRQKQQGQGQ